MDPITIHQDPPSASAGADPRELLERLERLRLRIAALARRHEAGESQLRRQRAAGRRP